MSVTSSFLREAADSPLLYDQIKGLDLRSAVRARLHDDADRFERETFPRTRFHPQCSRVVGEACDCFDKALAVATAVLGRPAPESGE